MSLPKHAAPGMTEAFNQRVVGEIDYADLAVQRRQQAEAPHAGNPLDVQVGGGHYKGKAIQPVEYISANNLNFLEGCIVKRITRWRDKNGIEDLQKIKHEVDLLIAMEEKYGRNP
jgi:hypothetical protein